MSEEANRTPYSALLDPVLVHQDLGLEGIAVPACSAYGNGYARGIQYKLVLGPTFPNVVPALIGIIIRLYTTFPVFFTVTVTFIFEEKVELLSFRSEYSKVV